jgi:hypothetical protein
MHRRHLLLLPAAARVRLEARLQSQGYAVTGETRRKGDFIILTASRSNAPWRLVVDGRTGEIVGQRLLSGPFGQD